MSHGLDLADDGVAGAVAPVAGPLRVIDKALRLINRAVMICGSAALIAAALVLTYSVVVRYFLKLPTDWQDEMAVFLLVGATFMSAAAVQARRGHIGIEALSSLLPKPMERARLVLVDTLSLFFCAFFAWKSVTIFMEAWTEDQHSNSTWGPPLTIPYGLMTAGMILLSIQILLQLADGVMRKDANT